MAEPMPVDSLAGIRVYATGCGHPGPAQHYIIPSVRGSHSDSAGQ